MTPRKVRLRALEPSDTDALYLWENGGEAWRYGYWPAPHSRQQIWEYIRTYDADPLATRQLRLMVEIEAAGPDGRRRAVGAVDLYNIDIRNRRAFLGVIVAPGERRRGYATDAVALMEEYAWQNLGLHQIAAAVGQDNAPSLALFARGGYRHTATLPQWVRRGSEYIPAFLLQKILDQ